MIWDGNALLELVDFIFKEISKRWPTCGYLISLGLFILFILLLVHAAAGY